jgi:membrane associated rhomboid family serine protease
MLPYKDEIPTRGFPVVTASIILINGFVYVYQLFLSPQAYELMMYKFGFIPIEYTHFTPLIPQLALPYGLTIVTSMFIHGGFLHIAGNMLYLWIFGDNIEDFLGGPKYLIFYLVSGLIAVAVFTASSPNSKVPLIGASGAIAGVLGAYMYLYPRARVHTLIFLGFWIMPVRISAKILLGFWFVLQLIYALPSLAIGNGGGGVAWFAHVGGFAFGYLYFRLTKKRSPMIFWDN